MRARQIGCALTVLLSANQSFADMLMATNLQEVGARNVNLMSIWCEASDGARAQCSFTQAMLRLPSANEIAQQLAEIDKPKTRKAALQFLKDCKAKDLSAEAQAATGDEKLLAVAIQEACAKQDVERFLGALRYSVTRIQGKTCRMDVHFAKQYTFTKQGENAWEAIESGSPGGTVVMTIWRAEAKAPWNYREARAGDPACSGEFCRGPELVEFRWDKPKPKAMCLAVES